MPTQDPSNDWRVKLRRKVWRVVTFLWFWRHLQLSTLRPETPEGEKFAKDLDDLRLKVASLKEETIEHLIGAWKDEHQSLLRDIDTARSRGAQLLAVTGLLTVFVAITSGLPSSGTWRTVTVVAISLLGFFFVGTVWLTYHTIKVAAWEDLIINPLAAQQHGELKAARLDYAQRLLDTSTRLRQRFRATTGYLRDAYLYFAFTTVIVLALLLLKVFAGSAPVSTSSSTERAIPSSTPSLTAIHQWSPTIAPAVLDLDLSSQR
jgi:hypothetical protein